MTKERDRRDRNIWLLPESKRVRLLAQWDAEKAERQVRRKRNEPNAYTTHTGKALPTHTGAHRGSRSLSSLTSRTDSDLSSRDSATNNQVLDSEDDHSSLRKESYVARNRFEQSAWIDVAGTEVDRSFYVGMVPRSVLMALAGQPSRTWTVFLLLWRKWLISRQEWISTPHTEVRSFHIGRETGRRAINDLLRVGLICQEAQGYGKARLSALHPALQRALAAMQKRKASK